MGILDDCAIGILRWVGEAPDRSGRVDSAVPGSVPLLNDAKMMLPWKPSSTVSGRWERCMSTYSTSCLLIWAREHGAAHKGPMTEASAAADGSSIFAPLAGFREDSSILKGVPLPSSSRTLRSPSDETAAPAFRKPAEHHRQHRERSPGCGLFRSEASDPT